MFGRDGEVRDIGGFDPTAIAEAYSAFIGESVTFDCAPNSFWEALIEERRAKR